MIYAAIMGLGVVGGGTADLLTENRASILEKCGEEIELKYVLDIRDLPDSPYHDKIVHDIATIADDPDVSVVAETIGGIHPAYDFTVRLLSAGKSVVTSNKQLVSEYGAELLKLATENHCRYLYEASTGGGIPILRPLRYDLAGNRINEISGILNGTTNYILTRMFGAKISFEAALAEAQAKGYAERNPAADIEGTDACRKIAILAATTYGKLIPSDAIHTEGITAIREGDVRCADSVGCSIKLLGRAIQRDGELYVMVAPFFIPKDLPLAGISGVYNGISVTGNYVGDVLFYGRGAGAKATASAVAADVISAASGGDGWENPVWTPAGDDVLADFDTFVCRKFVSMSGIDENAARVVFGDITPISSCEGEFAFFTSGETEADFRDRAGRLTAGGAKVLSMIRVYETEDGPQA